MAHAAPKRRRLAVRGGRPDRRQCDRISWRRGGIVERLPSQVEWWRMFVEISRGVADRDHAITTTMGAPPKERGERDPGLLGAESPTHTLSVGCLACRTRSLGPVVAERSGLLRSRWHQPQVPGPRGRRFAAGWPPSDAAPGLGLDFVQRRPLAGSSPFATTPRWCSRWTPGNRSWGASSDAGAEPSEARAIG